jgi:hypothetical protein
VRELSGALPEPGTGPTPSRRQLLVGLGAAVVGLRLGLVVPPADAATDGLDAVTRATLEAFADTIIPGEKRHPGDRAVAGAAPGPGAVQAGAVAVLTMPELPLRPLLPALALLVNTEAAAYALVHGTVLRAPLGVLEPAFVALPFGHRTALAEQLLGPGVEDKLFTLLAAIASLAFDTAAHLHTPAAAATHPGLVFQRFPLPDPDGRWRYPEFSYRRDLARLHPATTGSGSPA